VGRFGKFISCSRFPDCKYTAPYIQKLEGFKCADCGGDVVIKKLKGVNNFTDVLITLSVNGLLGTSLKIKFLSDKLARFLPGYF